MSAQSQRALSALRQRVISRHAFHQAAAGHADPVFDNSGNGPRLRVPGLLGGYDVHVERTADQRFTHGFGDWVQDRMTAREVAMLRLMNDITDEPGWARDLADGTLRAPSRASSPLISPRAWDWCLAELRDKARFAAATGGLVLVLNGGARVCKSDAALARDRVAERLASAVDQLAARRPAAGRDGAPGLVDPDWLPLAYGTTRMLVEGGRVGLQDAVEAMGRGAAAPLQPGPGRSPTLWSLRDCRPYRFSPRFQWLPCEVSFAAADDADEPTASSEPAAQSGPRGERSGRARPPAVPVRISSYINNLHPRLHGASLYPVIEEVIAASIRPWNEVVMYQDRGSARPTRFQGRDPHRIRTFGVHWTPELPEWAAGPALDALDALEPGSAAYQEAHKKVRAYLAQPDDPAAPPAGPYEARIGPDWEAQLGLRRAVLLKHGRIKRWLHPEPGVAFAYDDWKAGRVRSAVVPPCHRGGNGGACALQEHQYYTVALQDQFREQGLQVVVEIGSVELLPGEPPSGGTDWQLPGVLNDHIAATSVVYFSSVNVTPESAALSFRVEADLEPTSHWFSPAATQPYHPLVPLADVYGVSPLSDLGGSDVCGGSRAGYAVQELGTVQTPDGRLVAFPSAVHHRVAPCALRDARRPGRRRFLRLHLVDPHYRVASTRNVPPQQRDWWSAACRRRSCA